MAFLSINNVRIEGISTCVPKNVERTENYSRLSTEEQNLFIKTVGISQRRVADEGTACSDLCYRAAVDLQNHFNCSSEIDGIIFVSQSPDYFLPATSVLLQEKLGLKKDCLAFDMNLGCSGYIYGLSVAANLLQSGQLRKILLCVGDKSTISTAFTDKSAYPLFGDAGTATLLTHDEKAWPMYFNLQSDGSGKNAIIIEHGHSRHPYSKESDELVEIEPGVERAKKHLALNGMDIFNFALREVSPNINSLFEKYRISKEEIDFFVFHQANKLINESVRKKLKVDKEKVPYSIDLFGNTSSASVPLTICHSLPAEVKNKALTLLLSGFGVGYSWGSAVLKTENLYTSFIEYGH